MNIIDFFNEYFLGVAIPLGLMAVGIFYCIKLGFFHLRHPIMLVKSLFVKDSKSGVSPRRAVTLALAGTLGVGNIVGVASAIYLGGAGSIFWMWMSALCSMILKYAEIVLAIGHRHTDKEGNFFGGAMYYIKDFFVSHKLKKLGTFLASAFALLCIVNAVSMGSMIQANAVSGAFEGVLNVPPAVCAVVLSLAAFVICAKGTGQIVKFTDYLVPLMTLGYVVLSMAVIIGRAGQIPAVISDIVRSAFSVRSAAFGILGFLFSGALRYGAMRGLLSNEAGCGTAPAAHAVSNTSSAARQGIWGIFEVFVDTIVLCTMTAFVILLGYESAAQYGGNFIMMTFSAYSHFLGRGAELFMCIAVLLFAFGTIVCWAHYGFEGVRYFSDSKYSRVVFIVVYSVSIAVGAVVSTDFIWQTADFAIGIMTAINLTLLVLMSGEVKKETRLFLKNNKK